jgi:hypothetical protein
MNKLTNDTLRQLVKEELSKMNEGRGTSPSSYRGPGYDVDTYGNNPFDKDKVIELLKNAEATLKRLTKEIDVAAAGGLVDTGFFPNEFSERLENGFNELQKNLSTVNRDLKRLYANAITELK